MAWKKLLKNLGFKKKKAVKWEDFVNSLSSTDTAKSGATEGMLVLMGTALYILNDAIHSVDSKTEMAHAVNNI
jgi:hypothetical protein